jgi:hypothetical protein
MQNARNLTLSLGIALFITTITVLMFGLTNKEASPAMHRIWVLLGGDLFNGGYIQTLTFFAFTWSWFEVQEKLKYIARERRAFKLNLIPTGEKLVFMASDINNLKFKLIEFEKKRKVCIEWNFKEGLH